MLIKKPRKKTWRSQILLVRWKQWSHDVTIKIGKGAKERRCTKLHKKRVAGEQFQARRSELGTHIQASRRDERATKGRREGPPEIKGEPSQDPQVGRASNATKSALKFISFSNATKPSFRWHFINIIINSAHFKNIDELHSTMNYYHL